MKIQKINITSKNNMTTYSCQIIMASGKTHNLYFEVNQKFEKLITLDACPIYPIALAIGIKTGEDITFEVSMSKRLSTNATKIMNTLIKIDPLLKPVSIKAESSSTSTLISNNVGCFFSGGVDSFFTYLKNKKEITHLIFVHGFDIKLTDITLYSKVEKTIKNISKNEKRKLVIVKTNIRETLELYYDWNKAHAFALASVALLFNGGFKDVFASCGLPSLISKHLFMNPDVDKFWSTENSQFKHYGCIADKIEKLRYLSSFPIAMNTLRVCWENKDNKYNCSECEKCLRNMFALYLVGSLEKCKTFSSHINLEKLKKTKVGNLDIRYFIKILETLNLKNENLEMIQALEICIQKNTNPHLHQKVYMSFRNAIREIDNKYNNNKLFWYLSQRGII